jgi:hypothetical protein
MINEREPLPQVVPYTSWCPSTCRGGIPLGDMRLWGMTSHHAEAYAPEALCRAGANENFERQSLTARLRVSRHVVDSPQPDRR